MIGLGQKRRGRLIGEKVPQQLFAMGSKVYTGIKDGLTYGGGALKDSSQGYLDSREQMKKMGLTTDNKYVAMADKAAAVGVVGGTVAEGIGRAM